ncbi:hypothetical protein BX666DRAFT_1873651 [Dichotomocladium elegans]|nr:hypothetical protein BX666DRAFT_1873651 [Dichotomocladium elegans]
MATTGQGLPLFRRLRAHPCALAVASGGVHALSLRYVAAAASPGAHLVSRVAVLAGAYPTMLALLMGLCAFYSVHCEWWKMRGLLDVQTMVWSVLVRASGNIA